MSNIEKLSDLLEEYSELKNPLLDAVLKTLSLMHKDPLPLALGFMLTELLYKQNLGDTCIKADAQSINSFYQNLFIQKRERSAYSDLQPSASEIFCPLISNSDIASVFEGCSDLIGTDKASNKPLIFDLGRLYIRRNFCYETKIADFIKKVSKEKTEQNLSEDEKNTVKSLLDVLFERADDDKSKNEAFDMQKIAAAMAAVSHFCIITGGPGTGKTTTVAKLLLLLQKINPSKNNILLCAPTGKAAGRMTESIKSQFKEEDNPKVGDLSYSFPKLFSDKNEREEIKNRICKTAVTVDKLLGSIPHKAHKIRNADNKIDCDILIVDEVSMVDAANFSKLCDAIRDDTKVIMLGDKDQLASVEAGSVLNDLCNDLSDSSRVLDEEKLSLISALSGYSVDQLKTTDITDNAVQLNFSYRFAKFAGIGDIAKAVNNGYIEKGGNRLDLKDLLDAPFVQLKDHVELLEIKDSKKWNERNVALEKASHDMAEGYKSFWNELVKSHNEEGAFTGITEAQAKEIFKNLDKYRILCSNREGLYGIKSINERLEKAAKDNLKTLNAKASAADSEWFIGKVILVTKNNYALKISNGDVGFVAAEKNRDGSAGPLKVWFGDENSVFNVSPVFLTEYESGYAMTIHKSQGSEYEKVCMLLSTELNPVMTKELVYTGITRAKEHVSIYSDKKVFLEACRRRVSRESGLMERI
ncbi:exodeoxyribonuclease V subunit alpha [Succinivibrio dextrinosolvens]|uniref:RecBCD enzyme subunit RecD n=1 Tax=Succinivibrio dextrinosolvens TaxID=83771 RepID=A0A662Z8H2_9GAMM|nr:exodeoxyribonuclease V subunit alpha [Succinivibrio dextrinosolvens]SFK01777.1 DNA helicase/exodeoxyribonuclease V, alpha subunit [Succinivibrio dextrinosolvens]